MSRLPPSPRPPVPSVPLAPVLSAGSLSLQPTSEPSVLDAASVRHVTSARVAFSMALREMRIGPGDRVLLPAWHSPAMIPPVLHCGAEPAFYRLDANAAVDLDHVAHMLTDGVRLLVVVHYFGFAQPMKELRAFCDRHGLRLLEDCAHAFFGQHDGTPLGSWGDYAIASGMKFFPVYEGGCLLSSHPLMAAEPAWSGPGLEAKSAFAALEKAQAAGRLPWSRLVTSLPLRLRSTTRSHKGAPLSPTSSDSSHDFEPQWLDKRSSLFTRAVMRFSCHARIVGRRRANYQRMAQALVNMGARPLFPALAAGSCPWMLPMLLDDPEAAVARLSRAGIPFTRFGKRGDGACAHSAAFSHRVIAFPCHQELREVEIAWLCQTIPDVVRA